MDEVIITEYSEKNFAKLTKKNGLGGCYFCHRTEKDKSVYFFNGELATKTVELSLIPCIADDIEFKFPICAEYTIVHGVLLDVKEKQLEEEKKRIWNLNLIKN